MSKIIFILLLGFLSQVARAELSFKKGRQGSAVWEFLH